MSIARDRDLVTRLQHQVYRDRRLSSMEWVRHGITSRLVDVEPGEGNVGYGPPRDREEAWRMRSLWSQAICVSAERLVGIRQVHGADVVVADASVAGRGARPGSAAAGEADGLITNVPGLPLMTLHADCQPILLVDPVRRAVGVAHAGWRGIVRDIAGATVRAMAAGFGTAPGDLLVFLGPAIGVECYEVGPDVVDAWNRQYREPDGVDVVKGEKRNRHFDLTGANRLLLKRAGVVSQHVQDSDICTRCEGASWFSHRGQGTATGRFAAVIAIRDDVAA